MAIFAITLRIHRDADYDDRYNSTIQAIKSCCHGDEYWDEPTSSFCSKTRPPQPRSLSTSSPIQTSPPPKTCCLLPILPRRLTRRLEGSRSQTS
jgi:hypothetical protein